MTDFRLSEPVRIGVAEDEAFCFFYADNFRLLGEMGAEIVPFSPMEDKQLPDDLDGLLLYGGYPELNGKKLEQNTTMKDMIREKLKAGMPCMAGMRRLYVSPRGNGGHGWELLPDGRGDPGKSIPHHRNFPDLAM